MIVAVSMRVIDNSSYPEARDAISHDWIRALDALRATPVPIPNVLGDPATHLQNIGARGLILTGGDNLGPLPGELGAAAPSARDRTERAILQHALDNHLPVFGVCRGLQLINVHFGGSLARDLTPRGKHVNVQHPVTVIASPLPKAEGVTKTITNSYHAQGVLLDGLAPALNAFVLAASDVVEGLYHPSLPILAVQWHPERDNPAADLDQTLLKEWLHWCE